MMMKKSLPWLITLVLSLLVLAVGIGGLLWVNSAFSNQQTVTFRDPVGEVLHGTYLPGELPIGVVMLEGFGSDQIAMRPAASVFQKTGAHIFTFDFSGHGRSGGTLGFDNASTDRLAYQVLSAKDALKSQAGLSDDQILYFGHSLGARVAVQSAVLDPSPPRVLILVGTQINLGTNVQSEFFTGTSDAELDWVQSLDANTPASDILLLSGAWDDILTPTAAKALLKKLTEDSASVGVPFIRQQTILPRLLHNYEIYSAALLSQALAQLQDLGVINVPAANSLKGLYSFGAMTLLGLLGTLIAAPVWLDQTKPLPPAPPPSVKIRRLKPFIRGKLLLWLAAVPIAVLLVGVFFLLPLSLPVFNMIYVGFIGGYGIVMAILYWIGKVPGTDGKMRFKSLFSAQSSSWQQTGIGILLWGLILVVGRIFAHSGFFFVISPNQRLIWLAIFTPITALGFWIGEREGQMVEIFRHESGQRVKQLPLLLAMIGLTPFFLYTLLMGILGSLSGMIGGTHGLLILGMVLLTGRLLKHFIRPYWVISVLQAVLLYALILPQGVLFAF
jgi:pimeloyl-ACP methyl ester carboxylesterase